MTEMAKSTKLTNSILKEIDKIDSINKIDQTNRIDKIDETDENCPFNDLKSLKMV